MKQMKVRPCSYPDSYKDFDYCPNCGAPIYDAFYEGGGIKCTKQCGWWFCY